MEMLKKKKDYKKHFASNMWWSKSEYIKNGGKLDSVLLNSSAGLLVTEEVDDIKYGIEKARDVIQSGKAYMKLKRLIKFCSGNTEELEKLEKKYD